MNHVYVFFQDFFIEIQFITENARHLCSQYSKGFHSRDLLNKQTRNFTSARPAASVSNVCLKRESIFQFTLINDDSNAPSARKPSRHRYCFSFLLQEYIVKLPLSFFFVRMLDSLHQSTCKAHIRTHNNVLPFECSHCAKAFRTKKCTRPTPTHTHALVTARTNVGTELVFSHTPQY